MSAPSIRAAGSGEIAGNGPEGVAFDTRAKTVTAQWPEPAGGQPTASRGALVAFSAGEPT